MRKLLGFPGDPAYLRASPSRYLSELFAEPIPVGTGP
jgi:hypothetical protein